MKIFLAISPNWEQGKQSVGQSDLQMKNERYKVYCAIYKSSKKEATYLYVNRKDDFSDVPEQLLQTFGNPQFVMMVNLDKREKLAIADIANVRDKLETQGYYLQLPPAPDAALQHIRQKNTKL